MPVVIPAGASASSSAQSVPGQAVYDYILDDTGKAIAGVKVTAVLNGEFITSISPQVLIQPTQLTTTTDGNGFWQLSLVPNTNLSPANTTYTIQTPFRSYDIQVGPSGPYQSTSLGTLVNVPVTLGPATSSITGALTVSGAFSATAGATISGGLTVTGALSLPGAALSLAGPITLTAAASSIISGATSMSIRDTANANDNLLVSNAGLVTARTGLVATAGGVTATAGDVRATAGNLTLGAAASRLVPGATSFSVRDTANANDNLLITNAGNATVRGSLTVTSGGLVVTAGGETITAGDLTVTAGRIVMAAAASKLVPGATSFAIRNNADSQNNILVSNAGAVTILAAAAATPPTTNWGTVPVKIDDQLLGAGAASITFLNPLPTGFRHLLVEWYARGDAAAATIDLFLRVNGDAGANYDDQHYHAAAAVNTPSESLGQTSAWVGTVPAGIATAGYFGVGEAKVWHYAGTTGNKPIISHYGQWSANGSGTGFAGIMTPKWRTTATAITRLDVIPTSGNFVTGSLFTLWGLP